MGHLLGIKAGLGCSFPLLQFPSISLSLQFVSVHVSACFAGLSTWRAAASAVPSVLPAPPQSPQACGASAVATPPAESHAPPASQAPGPRGLGAKLKGGRRGARAFAAA